MSGILCRGLFTSAGRSVTFCDGVFPFAPRRQLFVRTLPSLHQVANQQQDAGVLLVWVRTRRFGEHSEGSLSGALRFENALWLCGGELVASCCLELCPPS